MGMEEEANVCTNWSTNTYESQEWNLLDLETLDRDTTSLDSTGRFFTRINVAFREKSRCNVLIDWTWIGVWRITLQLSATGWLRLEGSRSNHVWKSRYLCLYHCCPVRDNVAQSIIIRVEDREVDYLLTHLAFGAAVLCWYLTQTPSTCQWAVWRVCQCAVRSSVVLIGQKVQACCHVVAWILVGNQVEVR